jgi:hypothetical protein
MTLDCNDDVAMADYLRNSRIGSEAQVARAMAVHDLDDLAPVERLTGQCVQASR